MYVPGIYNPPIGFYNQIDVQHLTEFEMRQLIGKKGCNFKRLTSLYNLQYIWWNKEINVIEIWGKSFELLSKKNKIITYINKFKFIPPIQRCNAVSADDLRFISSIVDDIFEF